jgi:hypothetical protein
MAHPIALPPAGEYSPKKRQKGMGCHHHARKDDIDEVDTDRRDVCE